MKKKILSLTLVVCLLAIAVVGGTLAYFTDTDNVATNTFTVGDVKISLDETDVNVYGAKDGETRVTENTYKLIPGHTYTKDPMVTIKGESEESYVRMFVTITDAEDVKDILGTEEKPFLPQYFVDGWKKDVWKSTEDVTPVYDADGKLVSLTYEFRYHKTVNTLGKGDTAMEALFTSFTIPSDLTNDEIKALDEMDIIITAQAIQADGFNGDADAAFAKLPAVPAV